MRECHHSSTLGMTLFHSLFMSGHSKWANIRVRKGAQDAKRGKVYTRHARLIQIAAQRGGDPSSNATLRAAIETAKADSVPMANIERAIKKGTGELKGEAKMEELLYEAYGPAGTAYIIECLTDNRNRSAASVRLIVNKNGGHMADGRSVAWMFERKGVVVSQTATAPAQAALDELELELIDFGAEDFSFNDGILRVVTDVSNWSKIRDFLKLNNWEILSAGLSYVPKQKAPVSGEEDALKVQKFIEALEEDDDVSEVHTNAEM